MQVEAQAPISNMSSFVEKLQELHDPRDNRGKRHTLAFVLAAVAIAIMSGRSTVSGIQRFIKHKIKWLRKITGYHGANPVSRAQLPRILAVVNLMELNEVIMLHLGVRLEQNTKGEWEIMSEKVVDEASRQTNSGLGSERNDEAECVASDDSESIEADRQASSGKDEDAEWTALDGKTLRGADQQEERTLLAVTHIQRRILAQRPMRGPKESEIPAGRTLLAETGLERAKITLDALHLNPTTTAQIHQKGGYFIIQAKENQPKLEAQLQQAATQVEPLGGVSTIGKAHGQIEKRQGVFFAVGGRAFAERWAESGFQTLIVMERERFEVAKGKRTAKTSYYLSNVSMEEERDEVQQELFAAIRGHWGVEADNHIRDVTFNEDHIKTKNGYQGQVMSTLRTLAMGLFRRDNIENFKAALDEFTDKPKRFKKFLRRAHFL